MRVLIVGVAVVPMLFLAVLVTLKPELQSSRGLELVSLLSAGIFLIALSWAILTEKTWQDHTGGGQEQ